MTAPSFLDKLKSFLLGPGSEADAAPTPSPAPEPAPPPVPAIDDHDPRIPKSSQTRVESIRTLMVEIERQASMTTEGADALAEARRIARTYLPQLIQSYFDIGEAHRVEVFRTTGRSASFLLNDRLDKLIDQLTTISQGFARGRIDAFSINLGFIDQRFDNNKPLFDD